MAVNMHIPFPAIYNGQYELYIEKFKRKNKAIKKNKTPGANNAAQGNKKAYSLLISMQIPTRNITLKLS